MNNIVVNVTKLHPDAAIPSYTTDGSGCFDISSVESAAVLAGSCTIFSTGLAFEIPEGHVMLIFSRSGHGFKNAIRLSNCVGVIDSDYRGELMVKLQSDAPEEPFVAGAGSRIAQGMIIPMPKVSFNEVFALTPTKRGTGGFGSTDTNHANSFKII